MKPFRFELVYQSSRSRARVGRIHTPHGVIDTPNFVAVGTNGSLKAVDNQFINEHIDLQLMFCNTYHLMLQPGSEVVKQMGGLHAFIKRSKPIITDSGGFQVFSLAYGTVKEELKSKGQKKQEGTVLKITEEGAIFRSYRDGARIVLTPESSVRAQKDLGADIIIPLDELPPYHIDPKVLKKSLERTHRWEKRSLDEHLSNVNNQAMYAVVHGGVDPLLRRQSAEYLASLPFDGYAIGGSLGKTKPEMFAMLAALMPAIPGDKPNHLLGIGDIESLDQCVTLGVDTFDSSHPTRCARHGLLFTPQGSVRIVQASYKLDSRPIDEHCTCYTCVTYSRSYLHHLLKAHEPTFLTLATIHNLQFMVDRMAYYRRNILEGLL